MKDEPLIQANSEESSDERSLAGDGIVEFKPSSTATTGLPVYGEMSTTEEGTSLKVSTELSAKDFQIRDTQTDGEGGTTDSSLPSIISLDVVTVASLSTPANVKTCKYCNEVKPLHLMQGLTCKNCAYHRRQQRRALLLLTCNRCNQEKPGTAFRPDKPICRACESGDTTKDTLNECCPGCNVDLTSFLEHHALRRSEAMEKVLEDFQEQSKLQIAALEKRIMALGGAIFEEN